MSEQKQYERAYLGITITAQNYREILAKEGRDGINQHTKHLKAYLKGKKWYRHKWMRDEEGKIIRDAFNRPRWNEFKVLEQWIEIKPKINLESPEK